MTQTQGLRTHPSRLLALTILDLLLAVASAAAVAALAMELGFGQPLVEVEYLRAAEIAALAVFVLDRFLRLALEANPREFFKHNSIDFMLMAAAGIAFLYFWNTEHCPRVLQVTVVYVVITQLYLLGAMVGQGIAANLEDHRRGINPAKAVVACYLAVIVIGAFLLMLPRMAPKDQPLSAADAVFTSAGAVTLTSLQARDIQSLDDAGKVIVMVLMQMGGLGIMVFAAGFAVLAGRRIGSLGKYLPWYRPEEGSDFWAIARAGRFAVLVTLIVEVVLAVWLYVASGGQGPNFDALSRKAFSEFLDFRLLFACVFNAISAFCNCGYVLRMAALSWWVMGPMAVAAILGGLGVPVLADIFRVFRGRLAWRKEPAKGEAPVEIRGLSPHSRLVLWTSLIILAVGTVFIGGIELAASHGETFGAKTGTEQQLYTFDSPVQLIKFRGVSIFGESLLQSTWARSAGVRTISMDQLSGGGKLLMCMQMLIGGSPAGTAGGLKTVTLALLLIGGWTMFRRGGGSPRRPSEWLLRKALALAVCYLGLLVLVILAVCTFENRFVASSRGHDVMAYIFESCSAVSNCGLSCGVTPFLTIYSKYALAVGMIAGRLLPVLLMIYWTFKLNSARHAEEDGDIFMA